MKARITVFYLRKSMANAQAQMPIYLRITISGQQYTEKSNQQIRLTGYCFDDLGAEQQIKHFGNDCNVMAEILISRYEQFIENNTLQKI